MSVLAGLPRRLLLTLLWGLLPIAVFVWLLVSAALAGLIHRDLAAVVFWAQFVCIPPLSVGLGIAVGLARRRRNLAPLQAAFGHLGASGAYMLSGKRWWGERRGRRVEARFLRGLLTLVVGAAARMDFRCGRDSALARALTGPGWARREVGDGVIALARDADALDRILAAPATAAALRTLLADVHGLRAVYAQPGRDVQLSIRSIAPEQLRREQADAWLEALVGVAEALEAGSS